MDTQEIQVLAIIRDLAKTLDVSLDDESVNICYQLCKDGAEPAAVAVSTQNERCNIIFKSWSV